MENKVSSSFVVNPSSSDASSGYTYRVNRYPATVVRDIESHPTISLHLLRSVLIRATGRIKTLIDASTPNLSQAKALKEQAHQNLWADFEMISRWVYDQADGKESSPPIVGGEPQ